jgi:hypothetical protein
LKVDHKKRITRSNIASALIFLLLDAAVATGKLGAESNGNTRNVAVE